MHGLRRHMEDAHVIRSSLGPRHPHLALCGVFDGHLGPLASACLQKELPDRLAA
jgi:serine/threonine protein phosphatase PrpC